MRVVSVPTIFTSDSERMVSVCLSQFHQETFTKARVKAAET